MHACEAEAQSVVRTLAASDLDLTLHNDGRIVPGVYVSWDEANAAVTCGARAGGDCLVSLDVDVDGAPKWVTLNIELGAGSFDVGDVVAIALQGVCDSDVPLEPFIRSSGNPQWRDTAFDNPIELSRSEPFAVAMRTLDGGEPLMLHTKFHTLVVPLPRQSCRITLQGIRLFVVSADTGCQSKPGTLASFAA